MTDEVWPSQTDLAFLSGLNERYETARAEDLRIKAEVDAVGAAIDAQGEHAEGITALLDRFATIAALRLPAMKEHVEARDALVSANEAIEAKRPIPKQTMSDEQMASWVDLLDRNESAARAEADRLLREYTALQLEHVAALDTAQSAGDWERWHMLTDANIDLLLAAEAAEKAAAQASNDLDRAMREAYPDEDWDT
jgi:hypothetical protein